MACGTIVEAALGGMKWRDFHRMFWRNAPLFVNNGALRLLGFEITPEEFERIACKLETAHPWLVARANSELLFAQNMDRASQKLKARSREFQSMATFSYIWFDGLKAAGDHGIGSHYDIADTFILQQSGRKLWRLAPPTQIPVPEIRRRLLKESPLDVMFMPDGAIEFVLNPGDLLYIPLLWVHWGISLGPSVSISLAFTAATALESLWTVFSSSLRYDRRWLAPLKTPVTSDLVSSLAASLHRPEFREKFVASWHRVITDKPPKLPLVSRDSALSVLMPHIRTVLSEHRVWWDAMPVYPLPPSGRLPVATVKPVANSLLETLLRPEFAQGLFTSYQQAKNGVLSVSEPEVRALPYRPLRPVRQPATCEFDVGRFLALQRDVCSQVEAAAASGRYERFRRVCSLGRVWVGTADSANLLKRCWHKFECEPATRRHQLWRRPGLLIWLLRAEQAIEFRYLPQFLEVLRGLPAIVNLDDAEDLVPSKLDLNGSCKMRRQDQRGLALLKVGWPAAAWQIMARGIVADCGERDDSANNEQLEGLRSARTLLNQMSRDLSADFLQGFRCYNHSPDRSCCYPLDGGFRNMKELLCTAIAADHELRFLRRMKQPSATTRLQMQESVDLVHRHAHLTLAGKKIVDQLFDDLRKLP